MNRYRTDMATPPLVQWPHQYQTSQMPTPGLDDLTSEDVARELRGSIYKCREALLRAEEAEDGSSIFQARTALEELLRRAKEEGVAL